MLDCCYRQLQHSAYNVVLIRTLRMNARDAATLCQMFFSGSPSYLSLFSGCGGLDLGFDRAGYKSLLSVDNDANALNVLKNNLNSPVQLADLSNWEEPLNVTQPVDVLLAGSPCQGFSTAGTRKINDPRNSLLFTTPRIARRYLPKVIVAENVLGVVSGEHKSYWSLLHQQLRALGYQTTDLRVDSSNFGVAQKRKRILLIAWRTGRTAEIKSPICPALVLNDVLSNVDGLPNHEPKTLAVNSVDFKIAARIGQGQKLTNSRGGALSIHTWDIPEVFGATTKEEKNVLESVLKIRRQVRRRESGDADPVCASDLNAKFGDRLVQGLLNKGYLRRIDKYIDLTHTFNGKYRRLQGDAPSRTVDTRFGDHRLFLHPIEHRAFSVREAARVQGFPDDFVYTGNLTQQYRMIGNAVPPPMAQQVGVMVRHLL